MGLFLQGNTLACTLRCLPLLLVPMGRLGWRTSIMDNLPPKRHRRLLHRIRNSLSSRGASLMALVIPGALVSTRSPLSLLPGMELHILLLLPRHPPIRCSHHTWAKQLQRSIIQHRHCQDRNTLPDHQGRRKRSINHRLWCNIRNLNTPNIPQHHPGIRRHQCLAHRSSHHLRTSSLLGTRTGSTQRLLRCQ